jgi:hypothetical protein
MIKKVISFLTSYYIINILIYFTYWRTITLKNFERISKNSELLNQIEGKGLKLETMKQSFLTGDSQIFNPFYNFGFYLYNWKFIPSLLISLIVVYYLFNRKNVINNETIE